MNIPGTSDSHQIANSASAPRYFTFLSFFFFLNIFNEYSVKQANNIEVKQTFFLSSDCSLPRISASSMSRKGGASQRDSLTNDRGKTQDGVLLEVNPADGLFSPIKSFHKIKVGVWDFLLEFSQLWCPSSVVDRLCTLQEVFGSIPG